MTMLTPKEWLENIVAAVKHFADDDYQRSAWLGEGRFISSPAELYNELYDDSAFELYFKQYESSFTAKQRSAWMGLHVAAEKYGDHLEEKINPQEVLDDPDWLQVRRAAECFLQAFVDEG